MNDKGFTLVELVSVIIIIGILVAFVVPKVINLDRKANEIAAKSAISELNVLELQIWTQQKFDANVQDDVILAEVVLSISKSCSFKHYSLTGGALVCGDVELELNRKVSTTHGPGGWSK